MFNFIRLVPVSIVFPLIALAGQSWQRIFIVLVVSIFQVYFLVLAYSSLYIEPFRLTLTDLEIPNAPKFLLDRPLRILQLSDLHVEHITPRERSMIEEVNTLSPDLIVLTGDYINKSFLKDSQTLQETRQLLSRLHAAYGVYAINGNLDSPDIMTYLFKGLENIHVLNDEIVPISFPGGSLYLVGVTTIDFNRDYMQIESLLPELPSNAYSLLLYHYPERVDIASTFGVNIFLAGDTHGGQVRLPLVGPVAVAHSDNRYIMGQYQVGLTTLYVSRGLGMQGGMWPRMRFDCPPEMVLVSLGK